MVRLICKAHFILRAVNSFIGPKLSICRKQAASFDVISVFLLLFLTQSYLLNPTQFLVHNLVTAFFTYTAPFFLPLIPFLLSSFDYAQLMEISGAEVSLRSDSPLGCHLDCRHISAGSHN